MKKLKWYFDVYTNNAHFMLFNCKYMDEMVNKTIKNKHYKTALER